MILKSGVLKPSFSDFRNPCMYSMYIYLIINSLCWPNKSNPIKSLLHYCLEDVFWLYSIISNFTLWYLRSTSATWQRYNGACVSFITLSGYFSVSKISCCRMIVWYLCSVQQHEQVSASQKFSYPRSKIPIFQDSNLSVWYSYPHISLGNTFPFR